MHLLQEATRKLNSGKLLLTEGDARRLAQYAWPGNVRELQNVIERAAILARNGRVRIDLPEGASAGAERTPHRIGQRQELDPDRG